MKSIRRRNEDRGAPAHGRRGPFVYPRGRLVPMLGAVLAVACACGSPEPDDGSAEVTIGIQARMTELEYAHGLTQHNFVTLRARADSVVELVRGGDAPAQTVPIGILTDLLRMEAASNPHLIVAVHPAPDASYWQVLATVDAALAAGLERVIVGDMRESAGARDVLQGRLVDALGKGVVYWLPPRTPSPLLPRR